MKKALIFSYLVLVATRAQSLELYKEIQVPTSQIETASNIPQISEVPPTWIEFGGSTWLPKNFKLPSAFGGNAQFQSSGSPQLFISYNYLASKNWRGSIGLSSLTLERSANVNSGGAITSEIQYVNLFSVHVGAEFTPEKWQLTTFSPYLGLAALPTFAITGRSALDQGTTNFGTPVEVSLGSRIKLKALGALFSGSEFNVGVMQTYGSTGGGSLEGFGVAAGLGVLL